MDLSGIPSEYQGHVRSALGSRGGVEVNLSGLNLDVVPEWVADIPSLSQLNLNSNQLTEIPHWICDAKTLNSLFLAGNRITQIPEPLGNLTNLTALGLGGNPLVSLPESLTALAKLEHFALWDARLSPLPSWLGGFTKLTQLILSTLELRELPDFISELRNLRRLACEGNQISRIPGWIGNLSKLHTLELKGNQIAELPGELADRLRKNLVLDLDGNPLREPLPTLARRGNVELATYLESLHDAVVQYEGKLLLVGEGNVGKSSLVAQLKDEAFVEGRPTTHGIEISPIVLPHPELDLDMTVRAWDFGGQEVYRVSHQFFFSLRALFLVVWHARQGQERDEVEGWLRRIKLRVGDAATALVVATHCAERLADLDYPYLQRLFPGLLAGAFAVDSSTGEGFDALREAISEEAARLWQTGQLWSPRWTAAREEILSLSEAEPQIRYERFTQVCERNGLTEAEAEALAKLMHDLGLIIYYDGDEGLRDVVVLNPEWLTKAISYVLDDRVTAGTGGILDHARLRGIWQDRKDGYPAQYHPYFLRLMEKFDISYRLDGDDTHSLVPQLVPHQRPALPWSHGAPLDTGMRTLSLTCRLSEAAPGLIPWLTVRHHRASTGRHWRRGVFLRHPIDAYQSEALLDLVRDDELTLEVRAPSPDLYFNVLRDSIEDLITRRWPGLTYQLYVPCPGTAPGGARCPGQFRLDGLLRVRENGRTSVYPCADCGEVYEISRLLTGFTVPAEPLAVEVKNQLVEVVNGVRELRGQAAELADIAGTVRRVHRIVSTEVTDCPRLFTLSRAKTTLGNRIRFHQDHYQLTLWCEHPGDEHAWAAATYDLNPPNGWFVQVEPYARLVFKTLQLAVPVAAAIDLVSLPSGKRDDAQARLDVMQAIVDDLPVDTLEVDEREFTDRADPGRLTQAEGQALRAVRQIVFENDPLHAFGDMRRVQSPAGDLLWVCPDHYPEYDPGLPTLP